MATRSCKSAFIVVFLGCLMLGVGTSYTHAANISEFVNITPYIELEEVYDDNVFEIPEDAPLPEDGEEREDFYLNARAGVGVDITLERSYLDLGFGVSYDFVYTKYVQNTEFDAIQHNLDVDFDFVTKIEEQVGRDRFKLRVNDDLSFIPIDEDEPQFPGNLTFRNDFKVGASYKLISTRRIAFTLGYSYGRTDYEEDDPIEVSTVAGFEDTSDLTQESQTHTGNVDFNYLLNPRLTYLLTYKYHFVDREENSGELVSATFSRHHVLSGIQAKLSSKIHSTIQAGYSLTAYEDVGDLSQDDQDSFVVEASIAAKNLPHQTLMEFGYRRHYIENDFGDTLLTDNISGDIGIKIIQGFIVNLSSSYIIEDRDLYRDETTQILFGANAEYEVFNNMALLAGYNYRNKEFFEQNFLLVGERDETTHQVSGGLEYKIARHFLLKGMYYYTDKTSNINEQEFSRNKFVASGKVVF